MPVLHTHFPLSQETAEIRALVPVVHTYHRTHSRLKVRDSDCCHYKAQEADMPPPLRHQPPTKMCAAAADDEVTRPGAQADRAGRDEGTHSRSARHVGTGVAVHVDGLELADEGSSRNQRLDLVWGLR